MRDSAFMCIKEKEINPWGKNDVELGSDSAELTLLEVIAAESKACKWSAGKKMFS